MKFDLAPIERASWIILLIAVLIALESRDPKPRPPLTEAQAVQYGLGKLNDSERSAFEVWLGSPIPVPREPTTPLPEPRERPEPREPTTGEVVFNTASRKYHCPTCSHVRQCTVNCIPLSLREAKERRGKPCGNCGGCG